MIEVIDTPTPSTMPHMGPWEIGTAAYHIDRTAISHSVLEVFRESIPLYHGTYVTGSIPKREPTPAMVIGSALHCYLLEPDEFDLNFAILPKVDRRTSVGKEQWTVFQANSGGKTLIDKDQFNIVEAMAASIRSHDLGRQLIETSGMTEQAIRWTDPETGLLLKCRFDKLFPHRGVSFDLKTASDPTPNTWIRQAANFGYHRQAALYKAGAEIAMGEVLDFFHVVVGTSQPYEVVVYELDQAAIALGRKQNSESLIELSHCREVESWTGRHSSEVYLAALPAWAS